MDLIRVVNVTKTYRVGEVDVRVLKGVSFTIRRGELVAIVGASGSGKSTLMNILGCLDRPSSGEYWLDGQDVGKLDANQRAIVRTSKLGFVFQSFNLLARTTAVQNVLMPLDYSLHAPPTSHAMKRAVDLLERVGLADRMEHVPSKMSGGQQQRVAIARSLINQPAVVLADEPTGNLDSHTSVEILQMFRRLNGAGITVILVTHDPKVAAAADRTIRVEDGLVVEDCANDNSDPAEPAVSAALNEAESISMDEDSFKIQGSDGGTAVQTAPRVQIRRSPQPKSATAATSTASRRSATTTTQLLLARLVPAMVRTSFAALWRNRMRSALTALGIVIGVSAVIAMVEISTGSRTALLRTMSTMGADNLMVQSGASSSGGINFGSGSEKTLTPEDAEAIADQCPNVAAVAPTISIQGQVVRGNRNWVPMSIIGTTPTYLQVRDWNDMDEGEMFSERDVRGSNKVCIIGVTIAKELFDGESPLGKDLRVKNVSLRVVGVLGRKGANMMGMDQDDIIIAPWTTLKYRVSGNNTGGASQGSTASSSTSTETNSLSELYPGSTSLYPARDSTQATNNPQHTRFTNVDQIMVKAASTDQIPHAIAEITMLLHERHRIRDGEDDDFNIRNMSEMLKAFGAMSQMMGGLLLIVALISLAVGGVGIMNIMLVSVTERTREIGLRMAVGARSHHILRQFLIEAIVLCLLGGFVGISLGRSASVLVWLLLRWPIEASIPAIIAAFAVSATIGVAFGFYPAWKASRLDPIDALRYE